MSKLQTFLATLFAGISLIVIILGAKLHLYIYLIAPQGSREIIFGIVIITYLTAFWFGFASKKRKGGLLSLSVLGVCVIALMMFCVFALVRIAAKDSLLWGAFLVLVIGSAIILPVIGYFSGLLSSFAFRKASSSDRKSAWFTILAVMIILWPLPVGAVRSLLTFPERQAQKERTKELKVEQKIQTKQRLEDSQNAVNVYEQTQKGARYRVKLAGHFLDLRPFEFLSISPIPESPNQDRIKFWGPTLTRFLSRLDEIDSSPEIYRLRIKTSKIYDECPYTDRETAEIWCGEAKTANSIDYGPASLANQAFSRRLSRAGLKKELAFYLSQSNNAEQATEMERIPSQSGNIWRLRKTETLQNIYGDIYVSCQRLRVKPRSYNSCHIGFLLTSDVFVDMSMQSTADNLKTDSVSSIEQSLKYWELLKSE